MELVIKPTFGCNFKCSFCSSARKTKQILTLEQIEEVLKANFVSTVIVNGGDPLMMPLSFYYDLRLLVDKYNKDCDISLTTNLWDWYKKPEKWTKAIQDCKLGICTSFQFGEGRITPENKTLDVETFEDIFYKFLDTFGYRLEFISVLTDENDKYAIENVRLAQDLQTTCKLNGAFASGRQSYLYSREKLYAIYLKLFENGLWEFENNCRNLLRFFKRENTICPLSNQQCSKHIRCLSATGNLTNCPALEDDDILDSTKFKVFKKDCLTCKFFKICNGCMKQVKDLRNDKNGQLQDCSALFETLQKIENFCLTLPSL